jgi:tetratricopeptide (TPR) repeat protein
MAAKLDKKEAYQLTKKILIEIQKLNKEEQILYVNKTCKLHPELIPPLMKMLNISNSDYVDILDKPAIVSHIPDVDLDLSVEEAVLPIGTKISQYEIKQHIGSGGMGHVYAAQQKYPAQRVVALKLLKNSPNQKLLMSETQILARLNHPNIATLYEIDKTNDNQYFIAMEWIQGENIVDWCKSHNYTTKQVIALFQQLCSGINFAHDRNIIHCDIKPNNVLVTDIDGKATIKIIDFGISQFDDHRESYHEVSGTPAYLAPEVLSKKEFDQPDARRDVYALGILLKKLLPLTLSNDLQAITDKAVAFDKSHRYGSVSELSNDLNRFLSKQKVSARESSVWYGTKLLIQRRFEIVLIITLIVLFSLVTGFVAQYNQAQEAKIAQAEAEELSTFLTDIFQASNPEKRNGNTATTDDLLEIASEKLLSIKTPSLSDARFMHTIGDIYTRIENFEQAKIMIEKSLQIKQAVLSENHPDIIVGLSQLGLIYKKTGEYKLSEQNLVAAINKSKTQKQVGKQTIANYHNLLGNLYIKINKPNFAIEQHKLAIAIREFGDDSKLLADSYNNLGVIYNNNLNWEQALKYYYLAHDIFIKEYNEKHPFIGVIKNNMALVEQKMFHWQKAEDLMRQAWFIWKNAYGESHSNTITAQRNLAIFYDKRSRFQDAIDIYKPLINTLGKEHNTELQAKYLSLMGRSYAGLENFQAANQFHQQSLQLVAGQAIKETYLFSRLHSQYALTLLDQSNFTAAIKQITIAVDYKNIHFPKNNFHRLYVINILADIYYQAKEYQQATYYFEQVSADNDLVKVKNQKQQVAAYLGLGKVNRKQNRFTKSKEYLDKSLDISQTVYGNNHSITASIYFELARLTFSLGKSDESMLSIQKAIEIQTLVLAPNDKDLIASQSLLNSLNHH